MTAVLIVLFAYLLGSIPFGVLLARAFGLPDPRTIGSGNIGATNMLRTGNKKVALLTLLLDAGKGVVAILLTEKLFAHPVFNVQLAAVDGCGRAPTLENCSIASFDLHLAALALAAAAFGHMVSPWLKFSGGKGVATILGGALAFSWPVGATACCVWLLVYITTRYVSLASVLMLALLPLAIWLRVDGLGAGIVATACAYAIYKHRSNIARLRRGEEPKVELGGKK